MKINYDSYLKDNLFFAEEILFDGSWKKISQNEIDEMDDFLGKEDFAQFYLAHNGGWFRRARFYPEECYTDSINGNSYVEMDLSFVYTARQKDLPNSCASRTLQFPFVRLCA